jgi:DNA-binding MarR family transcriptional regulator
VANYYPDNNRRASPLRYAAADRINSAIRLIAIRHRALAAEVLSRFGLHPGQEALLMDLAAHGPRTQVQLAGGIGCEPPSVTTMVRKLEAAKLITRRPSPADGRSVVVELSAEGQALLPKLRAAWQDLADQTVAEFSALPPEQLADVLADLARSLCVARHRTGTEPDPHGA